MFVLCDVHEHSGKTVHVSHNTTEKETKQMTTTSQVKLTRPLLK